MTQEEQDVVDAANGENFLGFDDSGNAIIRNAQGQLNAYGGADWKAVTDSLTATHGAKSFNDYVGNEQLKSLGGEYQGIDEETGAAVFKKDGSTFGIEKDNADYKNLFNAAQKSTPNKSWFNPEYEKQFNAIRESGAKFSGFDDKGGALFKNKLGQYETVENQDAGFYKFAKKNMGDQKFAGVQGVSNTTAGENLTPMGKLTSQAKVGTDSDKTRRALSDNKGGFSRFTASANPGQLQQNVGVSAEKTSAPVEYIPPTVGQNNAPATQYNATAAAQAQSARVKKARPVAQAPAPVGIKDIALKMGKEYATDFANNKLAEAKTTAKTAAVDMAKEQSQPFLDQAKAATQPYKDQATAALTNATGVDVTKSTGLSSLGDVSNAIKDPGAFLKQQAEDRAKSYASDQLGFDVATAMNDPKKFLVNQGMDQLAQYAGSDAGTLGKAAGLLRGNVVENTRELAKEQAKEQALKQIGSAAGIDTATLKGGLDVGQNILKNGASEDTSRKTGETMARAAILSSTGGAANPENLQFASNLQAMGADKLQDKLGIAGAAPAYMLNMASIANQAGANLGNDGIKLAGDTAANNYKYAKDVGTGLKMIGKGDVGGVADIAKATLQNTMKTVTAPIQATKKVVAAVSGAIKSIFCFDQDTLILMENGSYKKIKDIKLGDKVELGGLVTAIGQSASDEMYDYNGVKVSAGHAVFEDGKWVRISDSKYAVELKGDKRLVFPMSTEHHLIVTKGQVWADNLEVDDTYDFKDSEILEQLNKKTVRNKMLKTYVKVKFGDS